MYSDDKDAYSKCITVVTKSIISVLDAPDKYGKSFNVFAIRGR